MSLTGKDLAATGRSFSEKLSSLKKSLRNIVLFTDILGISVLSGLGIGVAYLFSGSDIYISYMVSLIFAAATSALLTFKFYDFSGGDPG